jgi:hypothetical protein
MAKEERINIGCKLPHGLAIEIGMVAGNTKGNTFAVPGPDYRCVVLQGLLGARKGAKYGSTLVPKPVWETWVKANAKLRYVVDGSIFVIT